MAIQNVIISLVLRGHNLGSQLLREDIRKGSPTKKPVSSLSYRRMKGGSQMRVLVTAAFISGGCYSRWQSGTCSYFTLKTKLPKKVTYRKKWQRESKQICLSELVAKKFWVWTIVTSGVLRWDENVQKAETRTHSPGCTGTSAHWSLESLTLFIAPRHG